MIGEAAPQHEIHTVAEQGWKGVKNGELLRRARQAGFDILITTDRSLEFQQNIPRSGLGLLVLHARRTRVQELAPLAPAAARALGTLAAGEVVHIRADPS